MENIQSIKQRFKIIGNDPVLNRSLAKAIQVSPTDISVLVMGESGVGKEFLPKIIHQLSLRKHNSYIAVNCGALPEGTIESELFGHEKGAFTGATGVRKGYFEVVDKGTIFLDEVGELPLTTQVRLLRVLESGEFLKVGSSIIQRTNVRIIAATNVNISEAISKGRFREDLYYRLNTVQINVPSLRARRGDISLLFKKFSQYFAEKYRMPTIKLSSDAMGYVKNYPWPGNVRQLRNVVEQLSILESDREVSIERIKEYLPEQTLSPESGQMSNERDLLYKVLYDMRKDLNDLKSLTWKLLRSPTGYAHRVKQDYPQEEIISAAGKTNYEEIDESKEPRTASKSLSLQEKEIELIRKALKRNRGKRKTAAKELGISERTLYRKIKQFSIEI
ncbi:sigma-54 dependent transcriptional regulator [Candidatus Walczuchella endosymbiont of Icerya purchasi]|uniref:sigma-54 interaction domain-containing protein n=1 Tax=Candidatus Walczuchella endosymbiont of Icerya purchasi TaxID=3066219 RepID=UPI00313C5BD0